MLKIIIESQKKVVGESYEDVVDKLAKMDYSEPENTVQFKRNVIQRNEKMTGELENFSLVDDFKFLKALNNAGIIYGLNDTDKVRLQFRLGAFSDDELDSIIQMVENDDVDIDFITETWDFYDREDVVEIVDFIKELLFK